MKANHIHVIDRLENRISKLECKKEASHVPIGGGNPYWKCSECDIADPELSVRGRHYKNCSMQGIEKQINYFKRLLNIEKIKFAIELHIFNSNVENYLVNIKNSNFCVEEHKQVIKNNFAYLIDKFNIILAFQ